jgi:N-methylhydantoinase B
MSDIKDPIAFELFKNAIFSIADEMAVTICRTTYSGILRDNMDFSTSLSDGDGQVIAQGLTVAMHLGAIQTALASVIRTFEGDIHDGDIFAMNDPFDGGMHLPDIFIFKPIFVDGKRVAFASTTAHQADVGGRVPGSNAADSTEIYQEGLRIPPLKLMERGEPNRTLWSMIEKNVRIPVQVFGDMRAQLAACEIGARQLTELIGQHGAEASAVYMREVTNYTERLTRAAIAELPDGETTFEDWIDDDGVDLGQPIRLFVTVKKRGDEISFDWDGTSQQVRGAINATLSVTRAACFTALKTVLPDDAPNNDGVFRPITVTAPEGTIANVVHPGSCAARALTGFRMLDCAFGALARLIPERSMAASDGGNVGISIGGYTKEREPFIYVDFSCGTWGGRPFADGLEGNSNLFVNMASQSVEVTESEHPIQIPRYELAPNRAGAGKFRGGVPFYRDYRILADDAILQCRSDRQVVRPYGLFGGQAGKSGENFVDPDGNCEKVDSKITREVKRGDVFRYILPGGGGWGDPLERDPQAVLRDVRNELVSAALAAEEYGVIVDTAAWQVDDAATEALRADIRGRRRGDPGDLSWDDDGASTPFPTTAEVETDR